MEAKAGIVLKTAALLAVLVFCLFQHALRYHSPLNSDIASFELVFLPQAQWMIFVLACIWCIGLIVLTYQWNDLWLIGFLLIAVPDYAANYEIAALDVSALTLLVAVAVGKGILCFQPQKVIFSCLIVLLVMASCWHAEKVTGYYSGPRWIGLWNNPNEYGMLMGVGLVLAIGLLAASPKSKVQSPKSAEENSDSSSRSFLRYFRFFAAKDVSWDARSLSLRIFLFIAAGMMGTGLLLSYSRGAWFGTAIGLLYLAWCYGKLKWRYVMLGVGLVALGALCLWGRTPDNAPWYFKRLDFSRPSAQHRVAAWHGAFQMMRDHPLGVGWNQAVGVYDKDYSPPEGGAAALTMNSYLMLGTELGLPGLLCFISYVALRLRSPKPKVQSRSRLARTFAPPLWTLDSTKVACRAGALAMLVAFWFDGGLFDLPTATVFWVLLELGTSDLTGDRIQSG